MKHVEDNGAAALDIKKGYSEKNQMITLDPTEFDCHNIADAVRFEARILNL